MTTTPAEATPPARPTPITAKQWGEIEALWEAGGTTYGELCKRYKRSVSTFERHFKKRGITKGAKREAIKARAAENLARDEVNDQTVLAARIRETKEEHYKMAAALGRLTWNEILQAKKDNKPVSIAQANLKALDSAMTVLKKAREERFAVLGLDRVDAVDPDAVPELVIAELTPEQVKALRDRDHTELEDGATSTNQEPAGQADADIVDESE